MIEQANPDLARALLVDAGYADDDIRIQQIGSGWLVSVRGLGAGATDAGDETLDTPQEVAEALLLNNLPPLADESAPPIEVEWVEEPAIAELADEPGAETKFIFGDSLATDRLVRIGQIAEHAAGLIEAAQAAVGWNADEFNAVQGYVVSNLNESGAFIGADAARYQRFVTLSDASTRVRGIEAARDAKQAFVRSADHEAVATFDVEADWP